MAEEGPKDFFISYNKVDKAWAEWIAWELENEGYTCVLQAWDFRPGGNFVLEMDKAAKLASRTIAVLSPDYLTSQFTQPEWAAAFAQDPTGAKGILVPVRVRECKPEGLLGPLIYMDLVGLDEVTARETLIAGVKKRRAKPSSPPRFPGTALISNAPGFPVVLHKQQTHFTKDLVHEHFDVFISYSHQDVEWVRKLSVRLEDECGFHVWLDKWTLIPGEPWQQEMARGLDQAGICAVCIGRNTPSGWFKEEIQKALNRQTKDSSFRVIPVLLPDADTINVNDFLELRTWVDFRHGSDLEYAFYLLICGIKGIVPGRWPKDKSEKFNKVSHIGKLEKLKNIRELVEKEVLIEFQRKIVESLINEE